MAARAIARRLDVGERTVLKHLQRIYRKLGAGDRLVAVQRAQLIGLLPAPSPTEIPPLGTPDGTVASWVLHHTGEDLSGSPPPI